MWWFQIMRNALQLEQCIPSPGPKDLSNQSVCLGATARCRRSQPCRFRMRGVCKSASFRCLFVPLICTGSGWRRLRGARDVGPTTS